MAPHFLAEFQKIYILKLLQERHPLTRFGNMGIPYNIQGFFQGDLSQSEYIPQLYSLIVNRIGEGTTNDVNASYPE